MTEPPFTHDPFANANQGEGGAPPSATSRQSPADRVLLVPLTWWIEFAGWMVRRPDQHWELANRIRSEHGRQEGDDSPLPVHIRPGNWQGLVDWLRVWRRQPVPWPDEPVDGLETFTIEPVEPTAGEG